MQKIKWILFFLLFVILLYTRLINLSWGLPYPFHPDERNMANALQQLQCRVPVSGNQLSVRECFNPRFFAYGQFPLYLGYLIIQIYHFISKTFGKPIIFEEAVMALRIISAMASLLNVLVLLKSVKLIIFKKNPISNFQYLISFLILTFSPFFIQFSHFGTTESLLMLFYSLVVYMSVLYLQNKFSATNFNVLASIFCGLAIATKISSIIFLAVPLIVIIYKNTDFKRLFSGSLFRIIFQGSYFILTTLVISIIFSPHNLISFNDFLGALNYESDVALGQYVAFYTRQFIDSVPVLFQFLKIFPYSLGWPVLIFFITGFFLLPYKKEINLLRLSFLLYFLPNSFIYAKWTRFMAPVLPLMLIFAILFLLRIIDKNCHMAVFVNQTKERIYKIKHYFWILVLAGVTVLMILPGIAYLSIYQNPDVRFTASEWIYKNIPSGSYILSETANVVDIPFETGNFKLEARNYSVISFNFYDLDENQLIQFQLRDDLSKADYIFIPSRRIFMNHYCDYNFQFLIFNYKILKNDNKCQYLNKKYPLLNNYYKNLFSGNLGFRKVVEFSSFPKISLFGKTILEFPDEQAEETWTVFDHPVIRIYKSEKVPKL